MSWGERSCKRPCGVPDKCKLETCNVDCIGYVWNGRTEPDSKPKDYTENKLRSTTVGRVASTIGVDIASFLPKDDTDEKLIGIDIESEYELIQNKKSKLSANMRNLVEWKYNSIVRK